MTEAEKIKKRKAEVTPLPFVVKKKITFSETALALFASSAERCSR